MLKLTRHAKNNMRLYKITEKDIKIVLEQPETKFTEKEIKIIITAYPVKKIYKRRRE